MKDLHETHAAFDQPAGQQRRGGEGAALFGFRTVQIVSLFRLAGEIGEFRDAALHTKSHLELLRAGLNLRIANGLVGPLVQRADAIDHRAAQFA